MCLTILCKVCNQPINTTSLTRRICDDPRCRLKRHEVYAHANWVAKRGIMLCKQCGNEIPIGSRRRNYCCEECRKAAKLYRDGRNQIRNA